MEYFDLVDKNNQVIGTASRQECHSDPGLMHRAVHVLVENEAGLLFLQKRAMSKDVQPGKWDTSVGGHLDTGETYKDAAVRETREELGFNLTEYQFMYEYIMKSEIETEYIYTYKSINEGPFQLQKSEIETGRFWSAAEIDEKIDTGIFTPNFEDEYTIYKKWNQEKNDEI